MNREPAPQQKQLLELVVQEEAARAVKDRRASQGNPPDLFSTLVIHVSVEHQELIPAILENFGGFGGLEKRVRRQAQLLLNGTSDFGVAA